MNSKPDEVVTENIFNLKKQLQSTKPHSFGGWYCPDNLYGFPAVDIANWHQVPVINGRLATKAETQTKASLIFVDPQKYPDAKPLDITMPKLAKVFNYSSNREDYIIVIQALNISNDSIVGYRFLNGGNGSARLDEITFLTETEIEQIPLSRFVSFEININASQLAISKILTKDEFSDSILPILKLNPTNQANWKKNTSVNFCYPNAGKPTAAYANILFGNFYVQNDYDHLNYTEKFFVNNNSSAKITSLKIVCGPFAHDYEQQKTIIMEWAKKIKTLSEKC